MIVTYRVFQEETGQFTIREVFYEHDGRIITYGRSPVVPRGASPEELMREIESMKQALALPALTGAEIEAIIAAQPPKPQRTHKTISHAELVAKLGLASTSQENSEPSALVAVAN